VDASRQNAVSIWPIPNDLSSLFSKLSVDSWRLYSEYMLVYLDTYRRAQETTRKTGTFDSFYDTWLAHMDIEFESELGSERFRSILADYMNSYIKFRSVIRRFGYPADYYDILFYHTKKNWLDSLVTTEPEYHTPFETIYHEGKFRLLRYGRAGKPVLIVSAQINRFQIMDISPERSVVTRLLSQGLDVYILDWGYSGKEDDSRSLEDYVNTLGRAILAIKDGSGVDRVPIIGYCWGGLVSLVFVALDRSSVERLLLLATPVDFNKDKTLLSTWAKAIDAERMIDEYGHMDGQILDLAFVMRNPPRNLFDKYFKMLRSAKNADLLKIFFAVEKWLFSTPPVPGRLWKQIVNDGYKQNLLVKGEMNVGGEKVDLKKIDIPILCATAEKDDLVSPESTLAIMNHVSSTDKTALQIPGGHVGLCIGKIAHERLWPEIAKWLVSKNSQMESVADALGNEMQRNFLP
jgi:polyhydroxyalkanoate synthase